MNTSKIDNLDNFSTIESLQKINLGDVLEINILFEHPPQRVLSHVTKRTNYDNIIIHLKDLVNFDAKDNVDFDWEMGQNNFSDFKIKKVVMNIPLPIDILLKFHPEMFI